MGQVELVVAVRGMRMRGVEPPGTPAAELYGRAAAVLDADVEDRPLAEDVESARQLLDEAESKVFQIAQEGARGSAGFQEIQPLLTQVVERIDELYHREGDSDVTGVPTGSVGAVQPLVSVAEPSPAQCAA